MTNIFSAISGQFNKSFILSAFLPATLFVLLLYALVLPMLPKELLAFKALEALDPQWKLVGLTFLTIVLSGLLYNLSVPITRFFEGYPWRDSWLGKLRTEHYARIFDGLRGRHRGMRTLLRTLPATPNQVLPGTSNSDAYDTISSEWDRIGLRSMVQFPSRRDLVLPTRLGNVIRSFEDYSDRQYGIDAITLWPRLIGKIDKEYAAAVDDAKSSVDFMLNTSLFSGLLAILLAVAGLWYPTPLSSPVFLLSWLLEVLLFAGLAYGFYRGAIVRASSWGSLVKGAFDLYRGDLLKQLGYTRTPKTLTEERALWDDISLQLLYGDSPSVRPADYALSSTVARGEPYVVELSVSRGITASATAGEVAVSIRVTNADAQSRPVTDVVLTDTLPVGYEYVWNSAWVSARDAHGIVIRAPATVEGTNPYRIRIGDLAASQSITFSYKASLFKGG